MNLPNKLTIARIGMTVVMVVFLLLEGAACAWIAFVLFCAAALTDWFDGRIARARNLVTNFGKFMDPLADKMLVLSAMCWFVQALRMPGWLLAIVLLREFAVSGLRLVAVEQGRVIAAAWSGKVKTASTMVCLCLMLGFELRPLDILCELVVLATTVYSGVEYFMKNKDVFRSM